MIHCLLYVQVIKLIFLLYNPIVTLSGTRYDYHIINAMFHSNGDSSNEIESIPSDYDLVFHCFKWLLPYLDIRALKLGFCVGHVWYLSSYMCETL